MKAEFSKDGHYIEIKAETIAESLAMQHLANEHASDTGMIFIMNYNADLFSE